MSSPYEQSIGRALRNAAAAIPAPPESRWIPDRRARPDARAAVIAIAAATLILLSGLAITALRASRTVPASPGDPFSFADNAAWAQVRQALPGALVLRPTWIPDEFKQTISAECPSPQVSIANANGTYAVSYYGATPFPTVKSSQGAAQACSRVEIKTLTIKPEDSYYGVQLIDVAPINARGTTVRVRVGPRVFDVNGQPHQLIYLNWLENGTSYELNTLDVELTVLTRVLRDLEPMN
jgi:hypothetical protein